MGTSIADNTLGSALFGKTRLGILVLFFTNTDSSYYLRQVAQIIDCGMGAAQRELANLAHAGILIRKTEGRQVFFQANRSCPIYSELMNLVKKTSGLAGQIKKALEPLKNQIQIALIFGSFARAHQTPESDVDLLFIGDAGFSDIVEALQIIQQDIQREINPTVYTVEEFRSKLNHGNHFLNSIVRGEKLFLMGDQDEFAAMVE
jgi:uncharacterized protein